MFASVLVAEFIEGKPQSIAGAIPLLGGRVVAGARHGAPVAFECGIGFVHYQQKNRWRFPVAGLETPHLKPKSSDLDKTASN